jgi:hypothetical protein
MVWLHRSGLVFGNSIDAATVVLSGVAARTVNSIT